MDKLPEGWRNYKLGEIALKLVDGSHNPPPKENSGFPMYSGRNLINGKIDFSNPSRFVNRNGYKKELRRTDITSGDIFLSIVGTIGNCAVVPDKFPEFCIQRSIALIRTEQNPFFIKYFFESPKFKLFLKSEAKGSAQKGVYLNSLQNANIQLPPLPEQKRIVSKLDGLFERIDQSIGLLEENIKHTEALMASALDEVFLQLAQFSKALKISDFAEVKGGKRLPKGFKVQEDKTEFPYIRVADFLDNGTINMSNLQYISHDAHEKIKRYIITSENLYISIAGTIGKTGIIPKELDGANLTENAARLVYKNPSSINNRYIYFFTLSDKFKQQIKEATKTVAQPKLALTRLKNIELPVPTINIQNEAVNKFDSISSKTYALMKEQEAKLNHLKSLKESILDKAFKGEL